MNGIIKPRHNYKPLIDFTKRTSRTSKSQRISRRVRKQATAGSISLSLHQLPEKLHKNKNTRLRQPTSNLFAQHALVAIGDGEINDTAKHVQPYFYVRVESTREVSTNQNIICMCTKYYTL